MFGIWAVLTFVIITDAVLNWATTGIFSVRDDLEFITHRNITSFGSAWHIIAFDWSAFDNLFTAAIFIDESSDFNFTNMATSWEGWSWACHWDAASGKVSTADANFAFRTAFSFPVVSTLSNNTSFVFSITTMNDLIMFDINFLFHAVASTFPFFTFKLRIPDCTNWNDSTIFFSTMSWSPTAWFFRCFRNLAIVITSVFDAVDRPFLVENSDLSLSSVFIATFNWAAWNNSSDVFSARSFAVDFFAGVVGMGSDGFSNGDVLVTSDATTLNTARTFKTFFGVDFSSTVANAFMVFTTIFEVVPYGSDLDGFSRWVNTTADCALADISGATWVSGTSFDECLSSTTDWVFWATVVVTDAFSCSAFTSGSRLGNRVCKTF